jgi:hypothetical protein
MQCKTSVSRHEEKARNMNYEEEKKIIDSVSNQSQK